MESVSPSTIVANGWSQTRGYLTALIACAAITGMLALVPGMAFYPLIHYVIAVTVTAWVGGLWPGLFSIVVAALSADYFFIEPVASIDGRQGVPMLTFAAVGSIISIILEALHGARRRAEALLTVTENQRSALVESQIRLRQASAENERISQQLLSDERQGRERAEGALRHAEEQLRQSQKMEAVGRLAGGVAHDFNNLLTVILSYSEILLRRPPARADARLAADLEEIRTAGTRAADLTRQLLAFSRQQVLQSRVVDLNQIVHGMRELIGRLVGEDVRLELALAPELGNVLCDPGQMEQVIMNLVVNARDAMPTGGTITIATEAPASAPGWITLSVADSGLGMDASTRLRIFEPFFTTKAKGKGTGLGLSTAYGIVQQSGGKISVESAPRKGSTFTIHLPRSNGTVEASSAAPAQVDRTGSEVVLLVEDEDQLRTLMAGILEAEGYQVMVASNGGEAVVVCDNHAGPIDIVVTDVIMPVMSGAELVERLASTRPYARVLFVSGYTDDIVGRHRVLDAEVAFLQKPLTPDSLLKAVREVLDASDGRYLAETFAARAAS